MKKIAIVEDDDNIRELIIYALNSTDFEGIGFSDGEAFYASLENEAPSLVLLDIMLPGDDGITILKKLRASKTFGQIPVIMLTAKGAEYDRISGLDLGADDYITKPFSVMEVIARIRSVLRRAERVSDDAEEMRMGSIVLNSGKRAVYVDGAEITLTYKEFELLHCLLRNAGIVMSREKLLDQVWGFDYAGESRTVDMHIKTLRQKLGKAGALILTVRNVGYRIRE